MASHLVQRLTPASLPLLHRHFARLDQNDLRLRFGALPKAERLHDYVEALDFDTGAVFGVVVDDEVVGVTHFARFTDAAELGLSVAPGHRGKGIGSAMFDRAVPYARNRGIVELFMHCLAENQAMRKLARRAGMRVLVEGVDADAFVELDPPNVVTLGQELHAEQMVLIDLAMQAQRSFARLLETAAH